MEGNNILCPSPSLPERLKNTSLIYFGYLQFERGNFSKFERNYNIELKKYTMKLEKSVEVIQQMLTMVHEYEVGKIKLIKPIRLTELEKHNWFYFS